MNFVNEKLSSQISYRSRLVKLLVSTKIGTMIARRTVNLLCLKLVVLGSFLLAQVASAGEIVTVRAQELAAANLAMAYFRRLNPSVDIKHYEVELTRHRGELKVAFIADEPGRNPTPHSRTGGGSVYGNDMTYVVSIPRLKIIRYNFNR